MQSIHETENKFNNTHRLQMDDYISYNSQKEMEAITSWYSGWKDTEKHLFIQTLQQLVNPSIDDLTGDMVGCKIQRYVF